MAMDKFFATIVLITYNSSVYILETLDSIKNQAFKDFELIIADDCSSDNTVEICNKWLKENHSFLKSYKVITSDVNTGIPANCNRGIKEANGEWIKIIAGDDILSQNCLQNLYSKTFQSNEKIFVGKFVKFVVENGQKREIGVFPMKKGQKFFSETAAKQLQILLHDSFNFAPAAFIKKELFKTVGYFDEQYKMLEDIPYWIRVTEQGFRFEFIDDIVVYYRTQHESAVFAGDRFFNTRFMDCLFDFRKKEVYPRIPKSNIVYYQAEFQEKLNYNIITKYFGNKKNIVTFIVSKIILFPTFKRFLKLFEK